MALQHSFIDIMRILGKSPPACKATLGNIGLFQDVFAEYLWPFLSHPHQGRKGLPVGEKNKYIASLPVTCIASGPKIIFNSKKLNAIIKCDDTKFIYYGITFVYKLYHSSKHPNNYINILEHINIEPGIFIQSGGKFNWDIFITLVRKMYVAGLEKTNVNINMLLREINIKTYYEV
tara:strand:+ start:1271 stop:1798 length:528 start_codon:yes stop_codon:yes gene_type:complete